MQSETVMMMRWAILILALAACGDVTTPPAPGAPSVGQPGSPGDAECVRDEDCALLPEVTCCGECPPSPPFAVGPTTALDAILIEAEQRCAKDVRPCKPLRCEPVPRGCYARAGCANGRCIVESEGCAAPPS
jgi:hypothetical protein